MLSCLIFLPLLFAGIIWFTPSERLLRPLSLVFSLGLFALSLVVLAHFDASTAQIQFAEKVPWISSLGINYFVGIDGISLWLVMLTTFLVPLTILGSWTSIHTRSRGFHVTLFFLTTTMLGTFLSLDAILFYVFFEASLIPMYFMIGIWGGSRRVYATVKFFIYTMFGSLFMLIGIIALMAMTANLEGGQISASLLDFYKLDIPFVAGSFLNTQTLLFFAFSLAFAIKVPMFPFHTWLPDAHVEAPTPGSVILAGILLKMGTYGFMRFCLPIFPQAVDYWGSALMVIATVGIIYGALVAMVQPDMKKLVAYSSVSHMGYVLLGIFAYNIYGMTGGLYQMLNHGISTGALFLLVGMVYERTHTREIAQYGGLAKAAPWFAIAFLIVTFSSIAVPLTNGFDGEFLILLGAFKANKLLAIFAVSGVVLGATYMLWMVKRVFFGEESAMVKSHGDLDLNLREKLLLAPLLIMIFWMGIFPNQFLDYSKASLEQLIEHRYDYELTVRSEFLEPRQKTAEVVNWNIKNPVASPVQKVVR
jgi:NADH-quinone oxidoreductase subunit M